jgi:hypothetical protein
MIPADSAHITWDGKKKNWIVSVQAGGEVIKRQPETHVAHDAPDDLLRATAIQTVKDDGYEVTPERVSIVR